MTITSSVQFSNIVSKMLSFISVIQNFSVV
jgi:hypothetical protein